MNKLFNIFLITYLSISVSNGQNSTFNPIFDLYINSKDLTLSNIPHHFQTRVNLLDQFFKRFNLEINIYGQKINEREVTPLLLNPNGKNNWKYTKMKMLHFITDSITYYKDTSVYQSFEETVIRNNIKLKFDDGLWYAIAKTKANYKGEEIDIDLILGIVKENKGYKWLIYDLILPSLVKKDIGKINYDITENFDSTVFINPMAHETNFIGLNAIFNGDKAINILHPNFDKKLKNNFLYFLKEKLLSINAVIEVEYAFFTVPEFIFFVKYYNRPDQNSGWLISDVKRNDNGINIEALKAAIKI